MAPSVAPVLVAGAGPSGLVNALVLLQNGVPVRIIDKAPTYPISQRAHVLWPRTWEALHVLHATDIYRRAHDMPPLQEYKPGTLEITKTFWLMEPSDATPSIPYNNPMFIGQPVVEATLRSHIEKYGHSVELGTELVSFEDDGERVLTKLVKRKDGEEVVETFEASYIIGADGARGVTRKQLGLTFLGETKDNLSFVVADICVEIDGVDRNHWHFFGHRSSDLLNAMPSDEIGPDGFRIFLGLREGDPKKFVAEPELLFEYMSKLIGTEVKVREIVFLSVFQPNIRMVNKFGVGRVFVSGDAAHVHSQMGGQGLNTSVQDAVNLAWKVALVHKGLSPATLLDSYNAERLPVVAEMLNLTTQILDRYAKSSTDNAMRREKRMNMLGVNCRASPVVLDEYTVRKEEEGPVSGYGVLVEGVLVAGDRAPDAPGLVCIPGSGVIHQGEDNGEARLFDIFDTSHHTVLVFAPDVSTTGDVLAALRTCTPATPSATVDPVVRPMVVLPQGSKDITSSSATVAAVVVDSEGHAYRGYLVAEGETKVVVVRPDGVVGAIVHGAEGVKRYFSNIFV